MRADDKRKRRWVVLGATLCVLAAVAGCDWLSGSGAGTRLSPFLSNPSVTPVGGVLCNQPFTFSFRYSDPQNDMYQLAITIVNPQHQVTIEDSVLWDDVTAVDGRASYEYTFGCDRPRGSWIVTAQLEDARGHLSNVISAPVNLNSSN